MNDVRPTIDTIFSIVIPTLNEEKYVPHLLEDLCNQTMDHRLFEVIVVDGNSSDETLKKAKSFSKSLQLHLLSSKKTDVSAQRNLGSNKAVSPWILFMDADDRLPAYFLDGIKYQLAKDPTIDCFSCWIDESLYSAKDKPLIVMTNFSYDILAHVAPQALGAFIGVKKSLVTKHLFKEGLAISEDSEFVKTLTKNNHTFTLFRYPKYYFDLRRLRRDGVLKSLRTYTTAQLHVLMGKQILKGEIEYQMGGLVEQSTKPLNDPFGKQILENVSEIMKHHKKTAKKLLDWLTLSQ